MSSPLRVEKSEPAEAAPANAPGRKRGGVRRIVILSVLAILILVGGVWGFQTVVFYKHHATTDDAQIDGNINPVLPRVSGYVQEVLVKDNQVVHPGDVLVRIDPADLQAKVDQEQAALLSAEAAVSVAEAAVAGARSTVVGSQATVASNQADVTAARTRAEQTAADLARYKQLLSKEEISQQQYDAAKAAADSARAAAEAARATTESSRATVMSGGSQIEAATRQVAAAQAQVAQHRATLEAARLQLAYATLKAPVAGIVSKKAVEVGQFVQAGQPLLAIVQGNQDTWVSANFKETQLARMHPGQKAEIEVDAYPGVTFHGQVESLAAATGARFSLLPPDNATGNFTKVVQRVPVKIVFTDAPDPRHPLRVGMNVNATVNLDD
ncbi:MAG TPA: HlyD family secretion protein [Thermoanaerobaculia bacterium]|jgi:membrane fusion protein (multidrug efflux system)|nr:HlyD family secretion protein [Thermoanaerobaculia bacterium]